MKQKWIALVLALISLSPLAWAGRTYTFDQAYFQNLGTGTSGTIVTGTTGKTIRVVGIEFMVDAQDTVTILCGSDTLEKKYMSARSGYVAIFYPINKKCTTTGDALTWTKGSSGTNMTGYVWYEKE